ncbi:hypothetical protein ACFSM5_13575 [Lacibacterium aquatile]|uniref:Uncharacterized protein n=1 Tax=Lacibacterium aquatile TaxID=1168082 RepID=A0ABW5DVC6_9PROT
MVPYSAQDQAPGFDAYLLTIANALLSDSDPKIKMRGEGILQSMRGNSSSTTTGAVFARSTAFG